MRNQEERRNVVIVRKMYRVNNNPEYYYSVYVDTDGEEWVNSKEYKTESGLLKSISKKYNSIEIIKEY